MRTFVLAFCAGLMLLAGALPSAAATPHLKKFDDAACKASGWAGQLRHYENFPSTAKDIHRDLRHQLSSLGRTALNNGCAIKITCVAVAKPDADALATRDAQCKTMWNALIGFEGRPQMRLRIMKALSMVKVPETSVKYVQPNVIYLAVF